MISEAASSGISLQADRREQVGYLTIILCVILLSNPIDIELNQYCYFFRIKDEGYT